MILGTKLLLLIRILSATFPLLAASWGEIIYLFIYLFLDLTKAIGVSGKSTIGNSDKDGVLSAQKADAIGTPQWLGEYMK